MQYYMLQDSNRLNHIADQLKNKIINICDGSPTNGFSNTHFIANIDLLEHILTTLHNGTGGSNGTGGNWTSFVWREGYRTEKEYFDIYTNLINYNTNQHANNKAVDLQYITINNNGTTTILNPGDEDSDDLEQAEALIRLLEAAVNSGFYSFIELKNNGFHWGYGANGRSTNPTIVYGNKGGPGSGDNSYGDSNEIFEAWMTYLGISSTSQRDNYYTILTLNSNQWYSINATNLQNLLDYINNN